MWLFDNLKASIPQRNSKNNEQTPIAKRVYCTHGKRNTLVMKNMEVSIVRNSNLYFEVTDVSFIVVSVMF